MQSIYDEYVRQIVGFYSNNEVDKEIDYDYLKDDLWCYFEEIANESMKEIIFNSLFAKRFDIWAANLDKLMLDVRNSIESNEIEKSLSNLTLASSAVKAFRDLQILSRRSNTDEKELLKKYMTRLLATDDTKSEIIEKDAIVALLINKYNEADCDLFTGIKRNVVATKEKELVCINIPEGIELSIKNNVLKVFITNTEDEKVNSVAFDSWILTLKSWLFREIRYVMLDFELPSIIYGHYGDSAVRNLNRFLYSVHNMSRLFPKWFFVDESKMATLKEFIDWIKSNTSSLNTYFRQKESVGQSDGFGKEIESWLDSAVGKELICGKWNIDSQKLYRNLELNVFFIEDNAMELIYNYDSNVFDLVGIGKNKQELHLIVLEPGNETIMNIISSIMFYAMVLNDSCTVNGLYDSGKAKNRLFSFEKCSNMNDIPDKTTIVNRGRKFRYLLIHIITGKHYPFFNYQVKELIREGLSNLDIKLDIHICSDFLK